MHCTTSEIWAGSSNGLFGTTFSALLQTEIGDCSRESAREKKAQFTESCPLGFLDFICRLLELEINIIEQKIEKNHSHYAAIDEVERAGEKYYPPTSFKWTAQPIDLVELVDSIIHLGCINNGNVTRKDFYEFIGSALNVDVKNHRGKLHKISIRSYNPNKSNERIHFLPKLIEALAERLKELDNK